MDPVTVNDDDGDIFNHRLTVTEHQLDSSNTLKTFENGVSQTEENEFMSDWPKDEALWDDGDIHVSPGCVGSSVGQCSKDFFTLKKRLPCVKWVPRYSINKLYRDFIAGVTVALTVVPQGIAYAKVAGLPPEYGLYSSYMGPLVYMFLGTSKDITMGPTAVMSLIVSSYTNGTYPEYAVLLCFLSGVIQLLIGVFQLSCLVNFVSHPVISGFTSGAAITIAYGQVSSLLGNDKIDSDYLLPAIYQTFRYITHINWWDTTLGFICLVSLLLLRKLRSIQFFPKAGQNPPAHVVALRKLLWLTCIASNAVVVITATIIVYIWTTVSNPGFSTVEKITADSIPVGLPPFGFHDSNTNVTVSFLDMVSDMKTGFVIVPLLGILESIAIAKSFARKNDYRLDSGQDIIAIGLANIASSFFNAYPITGSFSRTAVNSQCNVATPLGGLFTSIVVISALLFLSPAFQYIPEASLAALIISSIIFNVDYRLVIDLFRIKKSDFFTVILTIGMCCLTSAEYGIISGIVFSLLISMCPMANPKLRLEKFREGALVIARFDHGLNFPSAELIVDFFSETLEGMEKEARADVPQMLPRCCVVDLNRVWQIDQSVCSSFATVKFIFERKGIDVFFIRGCPAVLATLNRATGEEMPSSWNHMASLDEALEAFNAKHGNGHTQKELAKSSNGASTDSHCTGKEAVVSVEMDGTAEDNHSSET